MKPNKFPNNMEWRFQGLPDNQNKGFVGLGREARAIENSAAVFFPLQTARTWKG
jgi:hypothetical protein